MKVIDCSAPTWFVGIDIILQIIFALVTLAIAFYAYRVYKLSRQKKSLLFGIGFLSISAAYFLSGLLTFLITRGVQSNHLVGTTLATVTGSPILLSVLATWLHILFMTAGLAILAYVTLKERGIKLLLLILVLALIALLTSSYLSFTFFALTSVFLAFITAQHYQRLGKRKQVSSLVVFLGFGALLLGTIQLGLAHAMNLLYISGHLVLFCGYLLLLWSLLRVVK